jgi:hypothetical protein
MKIQKDLNPDPYPDPHPDTHESARWNLDPNLRQNDLDPKNVLGDGGGDFMSFIVFIPK